MSIKLFYISKYAQTPRYGIATRQFFYSKFFKRNNIDVKLITSRSNSSKKNPNIGLKNSITYKDQSVDVIMLNGPIINLGFNLNRLYSWFIFEIRLLYWAIISKKYDKPDVLIVSSLSFLTLLTGVIIKKIYKCKLIVEIRDIWPLTLVESKVIKNKSFIHRILKRLEYNAYLNADLIVGSMPNLKEHVSNYNIDLIEKVRYMPTGFDPSYYSKDYELNPNLDEIFKNIPEDSFKVGYAGTIGMANCVDQIIQVAQLLENHNIHFLILGDGPLKKDLENLSEKLDLRNVKFLGSFPKTIIPTILSKFDVLINPWLDNENLYKFGLSPNKWIEYMYSSKPIIVSVNGYKHIINEANCGVFLPAGDIEGVANQILEYKNLPQSILTEIGNNGKKFVIENLNYEVLAKKYIAEIIKIK